MRVALALGGGGARGYAHIGVIQVLQERGFDIVGLSGCSIGALVGGLYAAGKFDPFVEWVRSVGHRDLLRLLDPAVGEPGALRADKIMTRVSELLDGARIEQLPMPFTAVATDLLARRPVWFQHGRVDIAVRASIALPPAITPVVHDGRLLADGGLADPLPMAATTAVRADAVVAVSLNGARADAAPATPLRASADPDQARGSESDEDALGVLPASLHTSDVMSLSLETMQELLIRYRLAGYPPDLLVEVPTDACRPHEFDRATEMIDVGRGAAASALTSSPLGR